MDDFFGFGYSIDDYDYNEDGMMFDDDYDYDDDYDDDGIFGDHEAAETAAERNPSMIR